MDLKRGLVFIIAFIIGIGYIVHIKFRRKNKATVSAQKQISGVAVKIEKFAEPSPRLFGSKIIEPLKQEEIKQGKKLKIAFVYVGPIGDAGWTYAHDTARKIVQEKFKDRIVTTYLESVLEGADCERRLIQLAERGYNLIFATSFGYMDPCIKVSKKYPEVIFMHCSGYKRRENVGTYFGRMYEAKFLAGLIAGSMTKSNIVGYIAPHKIPEVIRLTNAFALGVRKVNLEAKIKVVWTNSWYNPGIEKEAAMSLMDAGADVVSTGADSVAPLQAAEMRGKRAIGYDSDGSKFAPKAFLTSPIWHWEVVYEDVIKRILEGRWQQCDYWDGIKTGVVGLVKLSENVSPEAKKLVDKYKKLIIAGKFHVFEGEIKDNKGNVVYKKGYIPSDEELLKMNFFVEGIEGEI